MAEHVKETAPTLRKVKVAGAVGGGSTLVTTVVGDLILTGHLSLDSRQALVGLVSALVVWGLTAGIAYACKETHHEEYAAVVEAAFGIEPDNVPVHEDQEPAPLGQGPVQGAADPPEDPEFADADVSVSGA